jgi:hypothetical protein
MTIHCRRAGLPGSGIRIPGEPLQSAANASVSTALSGTPAGGGICAQPGLYPAAGRPDICNVGSHIAELRFPTMDCGESPIIKKGVPFWSTR